MSARREPNVFRVVASQTVAGFGWTAAALLVNFLTKMVLARRMPATEFWMVVAAQSFLALALAATELGIPEAVMRYVARDGAPRRTVHAGIGLVAVSTAASAVVVLAGLWIWFRPTMSAAALWATAIVTLGLPLFAFGDVLGAAYRGVNHLGLKLFVLDVARPGFVTIVALLSPALLVRHAPYVAGLYVCGAAVTTAVLAVLFRTDRRWQDEGGSRASELLSFGLPVAGGAILAGPIVNSIMPLMLGAWVGAADIAFYGVALSLAALIVLPTGIIESAVLPTWTRMAADATHDDLADSYRQYAHVCTLGAVVIGLLMLANDIALLTFLFGPVYEAAAPALRWVVIAALVATLTGPPNEGMLLAFGQAGTGFRARLVAALAGTGSAALLIPQYGLGGAIAAYAVLAIALDTYLSVALYRATRLHPFTRRYGATVVMATLGVLAATVMRPAFPRAAWVTAHLLALLAVAVNSDLRLAVRRFLAAH